MQTFFTSDEHYGHRNILDFCERPFDNVDDMREGLIARHNEKVGKNDQTFHLGDLFWRHVTLAEAFDILRRLNGRHHIIWGNHDERAKELVKLQKGWLGFKGLDSSHEVHMFQEQGIRIWLSHYAHRVWPKSHQGSFHLFGHTHAVLPPYRLSMDVGVDNVGYYPVSLDEVVATMERIERTLKPDEIAKDMIDKPWKKDRDGV